MRRVCSKLAPRSPDKILLSISRARRQGMNTVAERGAHFHCRTDCDPSRRVIARCRFATLRAAARGDDLLNPTGDPRWPGAAIMKAMVARCRCDRERAAVFRSWPTVRSQRASGVRSRRRRTLRRDGSVRAFARRTPRRRVAEGSRTRSRRWERSRSPIGARSRRRRVRVVDYRRRRREFAQM